jgi:DNA (cytosine-5)-methyltransferase 1
MRHGSLESGIGMFDYAAEMMGWENVFHCEISPFCRTILNYYWPKAKSYANVFGFNGNEWRGKVDIITAGFPCQPFSNAGKRKGSTDVRHIWPENMRIFREAQPTFIVCENVPGLITIENGMVFEQVCLDLENEGYEVQTFIIPAVATDKDHRRDRIWIVAKDTKCNGWANIWDKENADIREQRNIITGNRERICDEQVVTNPDNGRQAQQEQQTTRNQQCNREFEFNSNTKCERLQKPKQGELENRISNVERNDSQHNERSFGLQDRKETWFEAATRLCTLDDGSAGRLDTTAISKGKWRTESLKAAGNTIVWEIAFEIFKAIEETAAYLNY